MPTLYIARVAKLADALDLGSSVLRHVGSSPIPRTILIDFPAYRLFEPLRR